MSDQLQYHFKFARLITQEFALVEQNFSQGEEINVETNLSWGVDAEKHVLGVGAKFMFEIKKQPFIIIKVEGQFIIDEASWSKIQLPESNELVVPKGFMAHLAMLVVGSTRGVLHAKLEQTPFNQLLIPTVNVQAIIKEDVHISLAKTA
ncbi:MAG: hypothetical protein ABJG41_16375 [Cyclobacteriaceae bacterium]